jgi:hypothetical protein
MRTTLDIDDDVLQAAKELARRQKKTAGAVISELTRKALTAPPPAAREPKVVLGAPTRIIHERICYEHQFARHLGPCSRLAPRRAV